MPMLFGPTFAEMRDPSRLAPKIRKAALEARVNAPLDPINLFNITWKDEENRVRHLVLPKALTGVEANIVVMTGNQFPTGAHKVGPAYSILVEKQLTGEVTPGEHTLVFPSTGNFGIGGAWVGPRMGYSSLVVLPEEMSAERFEKIKGYGAQVIATPGCESNVKEIFDKVRELRAEPKNRILEQFSEFGNYRFHYEVTGNAAADLAAELKARGIGNGRAAAFVSAMGSAGTIAAGDRLKDLFGAAVVGLEPIQCPTLFNVGFGGHRIEGIGDKHVTWIHNVLNMDFLMCIDDLETLKGLQLLQEGTEVLMAEGVGMDEARSLVGMFGMSGVCNVLGAIKTARALRLGRDETVFTVATDGFDRYPSVLRRLDGEHGKMTREEAHRRLTIFRDAKLDWVQEGTRENRLRWHNQKYF
ncbi:MAG: PLP-dependent cysteine synthase family protein, partial [Myxococcales bacterium]